MDTSSLPMEIGHSRKKLVKLLIYCVLFLASGILFICQPERFVTNLISSPAGVLGVGIFAKDRVGLLIDEEDVLDQSSALPYRLIRWEDITESGGVYQSGDECGEEKDDDVQLSELWSLTEFYAV